MVYPPGIPIFIPGEIITEENISYIFKNIEIGLLSKDLKIQRLK